ncbi:hypothetical protein ACRHQP_00485 [Burkholderia pseudomallei]|uniref:hypothetical protein n=1 Tax=Burkholderia pseudomallei TaxID=28450 RepID=UPI0040630C79
MSGLVVSLFDRTGNMVRPWAEAGYECRCYDIAHEGLHIEKVGSGYIRYEHMDLHHRSPNIGLDIDMVFAFPPCTHLAVSGARWFKGKGLRALADSIHMFATAAEFCDASDAPYLIENPVSTISTYWRKPDHAFHPYDFTGFELEDNYTKKTCLWVGNGFVMPAPNRAPGLEKPDNRIHAAPPSDDRGDIRSATPMGFARAVFMANGQQLRDAA